LQAELQALAALHPAGIFDSMLALPFIHTTVQHPL